MTAMDSRCEATHPALAPIPLHPPSSHPCAQCALSIISNPKAVFTIRRSACAILHQLSNDRPCLVRLGAPFLTELLHSLLNTLVALTPSEYKLVQEITAICVFTACHFDECLDDDSHKRLSAFLFCECAAVIMLDDTSLNSMMGAFLMGRLFERCSSCLTHLPFESLPTDFAHHFLMQVNGLATLHPSLNALLEHVLKETSSGPPRKLLQAASNILRTPRDVDADRMFLTVVAHVTQTDPDAILECEAILVVLKTTFMCSFVDLRKTAASIIEKISDKPNHLKRLEEASIFEYIVESLRITESSESNLMLLHYSIAALSALSEKQTSEKWVYSLDVILSVAPHLGPFIHELLPIVCAALQNAPASLFSNSLIDAVVSFIMQMLTQKKDVADVINSLTRLLERIRPDLKSQHSLLGIVETTLVFRDYMKCTSTLVNMLGRHFIGLVKTSDAAIQDDCRGLGRRLSSIAFKTWGPGGNDIIEFLGVSDCAESYPCDTVTSFMRMRTTMMDATFVKIGAYDFEDWNRVILWCWQTLPPKNVFACYLHSHGNDQVAESAALYCQRISAEDPSDDMPLSAAFQVTEDSFLDALASRHGSNIFPGAIKLVRRSLELDLLQSICRPELVLESLQRLLAAHLSSSCPQSKDDQSFQIVDVLRLISKVCVQHGLAFPKLEIPNVVFSQVFATSDLFFSTETNTLLFFSVVTAEKRTFADVAAWELFADIYSKSLHPCKPLADVEARIVGNSACLESAVYAITKAKDPVLIAECVVAITSKTSKASANLTRILEKMGILSTSIQVFRDIETELSQYDPTQHPLSHNSELQMGMKAGISILTLLINTAPTQDVPRSIGLTRAVCDVIVCGLAKGQPNRISKALLALALEYLSALGPLWAFENSTRRYLCKSGVTDGLVRTLRSLAKTNITCCHLVTTACTFLTLCSNSLSDSDFAFPDRTITPSSLGEIRWDTFLSSFPLPADIDSAVCIAKCCDFLKSTMTEELLNQMWVKDGKSLTLTVTLAVASCSVFAFTREASLDLLITLRESQKLMALWDRLAITKEIPLAPDT